MSDWKLGLGKWLLVLNAAEREFKIPPDLLARMCWQESRGKPDAKSPAGAVGIMQLEPKYFPDAGKDPVVDIETAGKYSQGLYARFKDWQLCLAAYNWGPGAVQWWLTKKETFAQMPKETRNYVIQITQDVPVKGCLWETSTPKNPLRVNPGGFRQALQSAAAHWDSRFPSLSLQSVMRTLRIPSAPSLVRQSQPSVLQQQVISSKTEEGDNMANQSFGQMLLALLEGDLAQIGGAPLLALLSALQKHAGNNLQQAADILAFQAQAPAAGIQLEVEVQQQLIQLVIGKLQSGLAKAPPAGGITA